MSVGLEPSDRPAPEGNFEAQLVARLRAGDGAAYEQVVRTHSGRMLTVARRFFRSEEDARDAVQEAFISMLRAIDRFQQGAQLSTWLHRIVVNAALMKLRARRSRPEVALDDLLPRFSDDGHHLDPPAPFDERCDLEMVREETRSLVRQAIDQLPDTYRTVLLLRDIEELSTDETAQILGISDNAVKVRLHRAHQALRTLIERQFKGQLR